MPAMPYIRTVLIILVICFFASNWTTCNSKNHQITLDDLELAESTPAQCSDSFMRQITLRQIVNRISVYETLDGNAVSIDSHQSQQYKEFLHLSKIASEEDLVRLTQHKNGNVKAYAFEALCDRNSSLCKKVFEQHLNDKTKIREFSGCIQLEKSINIFYFQLLSSKMNQKEIGFYKKELAKNFTPEEWKFIKQMSFSTDY